MGPKLVSFGLSEYVRDRLSIAKADLGKLPRDIALRYSWKLLFAAVEGKDLEPILTYLQSSHLVKYAIPNFHSRHLETDDYSSPLLGECLVEWTDRQKRSFASELNAILSMHEVDLRSAQWWINDEQNGLKIDEQCFLNLIWNWIPKKANQPQDPTFGTVEMGSQTESEFDREQEEWLELAEQAFDIASELGQQFRIDYDDRKKHHPIDEENWKKYAPLFRTYCELLATLHQSAESLPPAFNRVREYLTNGIQLAKRIQGEVDGPDGRNYALHLNFHGVLFALASEASHAIQVLKQERQVRNPLKEIEDNSAKEITIDTTPISPKPPNHLVEKASCSIPTILANLHPLADGTIEIVARLLVTKLVQKNHSLAAAHWGIHDLVQSGKLKADRVEGGFPGWSTHSFPAGTEVFKSIPKGKPAPFENFKVIATSSLWAWWGESNPSTKNERGPDVPSKRKPSQPPKAKTIRGAKPKFGQEEDLQFKRDWLRAKETGVPFKQFCKDLNITQKEGRRTLSRVRVRARNK